MDEITKQPFSVGCDNATPRDRRNLTNLLWASVGWAVCLVSASFAIRRELLPEGPMAWLAAALPTVIGVFVVVLYGRYLREADELQRIIQLKALALGFGATWVAISGYPLFERLGAPPVDTGTYVVVMVVFHAIGNLHGWSQHR